MKKILYLVLLQAAVSLSLVAQTSTNVRLKLNHLLNGQKLEYMQPVQIPGSYFFKVELLRYYVSEIKIVHDGGVVDNVVDIWLLVNPAKNNEYDLGNFKVTNIESIEFSLGVDPAHNHLDPATYPADHPLAFQNPSMDWGWTTGYRFITFEGYAGSTAAKATNNFQLHTLGDANYKVVKLNTKATSDAKGLVVTLDAEYTNLLKSISAVSGVVSHSATGAAATQMKNLSTIVFSPLSPTSVHLLELLPVSLSPNPATSSLRIVIPIVGAAGQQVILSDLAGKVIAQYAKASETLDIPLNYSKGNYLVSILENNKVVAREKLVIVE
jgi:hypothetical protein